MRLSRRQMIGDEQIRSELQDDGVAEVGTTREIAIDDGRCLPGPGRPARGA